jgi:GGDEF domain-containing protein
VEFNHQNVWLDTQTFSTYTQTIKQHPHHDLHTCQECMQKLEDSIDLYRGDFLLDLILNEVTAFQEWVILQRERHFRNYVEVLKALSMSYYHQKNWDKTYKYAYKYVEMAPLEEAAHRLLMRLLTLNGRRTAALQQYQMCKSIIKRELGIEPSLETQQLYEKIQNNLPIERIDTGILSHHAQDLQKAGYQDPLTGPLYDPITNIPLRPIFLDRLRHALTRSRRNQIDTALVILSIAFPRQSTFKPIQKNQIDTLIVRRLLGTLREDDTLGRISENEYGIILEDIKDPGVVPMIIDKIMGSIDKPIQLFDELIKTNLSIGWHLGSQDAYNAEEVFSKAEIAMRTDQLHKSLHQKQS